MDIKFKVPDRTEKMSDTIVAQIRDSILSGKVNAGDRLANEKELIEQFSVSKATMREALRVLEVMGLIEIRKGIGGGVFIAEVEMKTTIYNILNFLHFQTVSIKDITFIRYLFEPTIAEIAASKVTEKDITHLERTILEYKDDFESDLSRGISFHRYLARMTENSILIMTTDLIDNLLSSIKSKLKLETDFYDRVRDSHKIILECIKQKDSAAAGIAMANDVIKTGEYLSKITNGESFIPPKIKDEERWLKLTNNRQVVSQGSPELEKEGIFSRRVGSSQLYVVLNGYK
jgi:DNA-binding FadR family transcriptional regulator